MLVIATWLTSPCPDWRSKKIATTSMIGPLTSAMNAQAAISSAHTTPV
jgi:hypothetical protein